MSRIHARLLSCVVAVVVVGALLAGCGQAGGALARPTTTAPVLQHVIPGPDLLAAHLFTPTSGWVRTSDRVLTSVDSGRTWADVTPPSSPTAPLETAFFLDPYHAWAVVRSSHIDLAADKAPLELFVSSDGGQRWIERQMPATIPLDTPGPVYLTFINPMRGWLIVDQGSHSGFMYFKGFQTIDGGKTWTASTYPQSAPLLFANELDGFSVYSENDSTWGAFATHDGGQTWARLAVPPINGSSVSPAFELPVFSDDKNGVLAGGMVDAVTGGTASEVFYRTSDGGRSWGLAATVPNPNPPSSAQLGGVMNGKAWLAAFLGPGPLAGRTYTRLKATHDGGRSWEWMPTLVSGAFGDEISFAGSNGWGIVRDAGCRGFKSDCFTNTGLFQTVDGGAHWLQVSLP